MRVIRFAVATVLASSTLGACATKGFVRRGLEDQRASLTTTMNSSMTAEQSARAAADSALRGDVNGVKTDLASLRADLSGLRSEFGARITAVEGQVKFAMPVHFSFDDATVRELDQASLERFAQVAMNHYRGATITVEGFADPAGSVAYNLRLSKERADAVKDYLVAKGLDASLLKTVGYGKSRLVKPNAQGNAAGAELNRRVTFVVEAPSEATVAVLSAR